MSGVSSSGPLHFQPVVISLCLARSLANSLPRARPSPTPDPCQNWSADISADYFIYDLVCMRYHEVKKELHFWLYLALSFSLPPALRLARPTSRSLADEMWKHSSIFGALTISVFVRSSVERLCAHTHLH